MIDRRTDRHQSYHIKSVCVKFYLALLVKLPILFICSCMLSYEIKPNEGSVSCILRYLRNPKKVSWMTLSTWKLHATSSQLVSKHATSKIWHRLISIIYDWRGHATDRLLNYVNSIPFQPTSKKRYLKKVGSYHLSLYLFYLLYTYKNSLKRLDRILSFLGFRISATMRLSFT